MHAQLSRLCQVLICCAYGSNSVIRSQLKADFLQHTLISTPELLMLCCLPAGTGKTLLAKAVAGEAGVPFFYRAGSEFEVRSLKGRVVCPLWQHSHPEQAACPACLLLCWVSPASAFPAAFLFLFGGLLLTCTHCIFGAPLPCWM